MPTRTWWRGTKTDCSGSGRTVAAGVTAAQGERGVEAITAWIWGIVAALTALVGLFMAARAHDGTFALAGYLLMLFGILYIFFLIRHSGADGMDQRVDD